jgi:hypothetical protein
MLRVHFKQIFQQTQQKWQTKQSLPSDYAFVTELCESKPLPDAPKGMTPCVAASQSRNQTARMLREMTGT